MTTTPTTRRLCRDIPDDAPATMFAPAPVGAYRQVGLAVPGQFTDCRIDAYWNGRFAGSFRLYVAGGQLVLAGL